MEGDCCSGKLVSLHSDESRRVCTLSLRQKLARSWRLLANVKSKDQALLHFHSSGQFPNPRPEFILMRIVAGLEKVFSFKSLHQPENAAFRNRQATSQLGNRPTRLLWCKEPQNVASSFQGGGGRPGRFSTDYLRLRSWIWGTAADFVQFPLLRFHLPNIDIVFIAHFIPVSNLANTSRS